MKDAQSKQPKAPQGAGFVPTMTSDQALNAKPIQWKVLTGEDAQRFRDSFSNPKFLLKRKGNTRDDQRPEGQQS